MIERIVGVITDYDGETMGITAAYDNTDKILKQGIRCCEITLTDGRSISAQQRRKAYATIRDISEWNGDAPEWLKEYFKMQFCEEMGIDTFSLSDCDMSTAREFISFLIEFAVVNGVPLAESALERTDDIGRYLYCCLANRKCAVCGKPADIHHVDRVGMGRDRKTIIHEGMEAMALCRIHHTECHDMGQTAFNEKYHAYGIALDKRLCEILGLTAKAD